MSISLHNQEKPICPYCGEIQKLGDLEFDQLYDAYADCKDCGKALKFELTVAYNIYGIELLRDQNYSPDEPTTNEA